MRSLGGRGKLNKPKPDDAKQSQRFVETARKLDVDESGDTFNRAIQAIAPVMARTSRKKSAVSKK